MQVNQEQATIKQMVPINPTVIDTPTGLVMVWGFEHVSEKMLSILKIMLSHDAFESIYHGIKSVVFRTDGYPREEDRAICASFAPDVCGIAINMDKTLERAIDRSMDHPETSLLTSWWTEMILNFGHELHHGVRWHTDRAKLYGDEKLLADEEKRAEKYANDIIVELAQEYDIEMSAIEDESWFNNQVIELFSGKDESDKWGKSQKEMITESIVWRHEPKNSEAIVLHTFKDFICMISNGDIASEEWNKETITLKPNSPTLDEQLNGKTVTINATGEQGEVVKPTATDPTSNNSTAGVYVDEMEDYSNIYEEGVGEYDDDQVAQPLSPVQPVTPPVTTNPATTTFPFNNMSAQQDVQTNQTATYDMATINRVAKDVYTKMFHFIFKNCGPLRDSDVGFSNPEAVLTTTLPLTPEEVSIFVSMDHLDINGRWCPGVSTKGGLLGKVMKNTKLPSYEVTLLVNGTTHKRLFIPQNPNRRKNGILTQRALEARSGDTIAYIKNQDTDEWGPYFINGEYRLPRGK